MKDFSPNNVSLNERKRLLYLEFQNYDANKNKTTYEDLLSFLDKKGGKTYDRDLSKQIYETIKKDDGKLKIDDFINSIIETEDTINFRIELEKNKINELKNQKDSIIKQKNELIESNKNDQNQMNAHLLIQIYEAVNLEPLNEGLEIDSQVIISCGSQEQETVFINNGNNPMWNEAFKLIIDKDVTKVLFIVTDKERKKKGEEIGFVQINLDELIDQNTQKRVEYIVRKDGLRTKSKLAVLLKYVYSKLKIFDDDIRKTETEIKILEYQISNNEMALQNLKQPFESMRSSTFNNLYNADIKRNIPVPVTESKPIIEIEPDLGRLRVREWEKNKSERIKDFLQSKKVSNSASIFCLTSLLLLIFSIFVCYIRATYLELTLILTPLALGISNKPLLSQVLMRMLIFGCLFDILIEIVWLILYTKNWTIDIDSFLLKNVKIMSLVFAYIRLLIKVLFTLEVWHRSIHFKAFLQDLRYLAGVNDFPSNKINIDPASAKNEEA